MKLAKVELVILRFFLLIEKTRITRYVYFWASMLMTWKFVVWAWTFAETSARPGSDVALIIGAIGVPLTTATGMAFKDFVDSSRTKPA